jgi:hypothetical protein
MPIRSDQMRDLLALGISAELLLEIVTIFERDASRDGRDGKAKAAERARKYRARQQNKSGMAGPNDAGDASRKTSRTPSRDGRDDQLILSSSLLVEAQGLPKEVRKKKERAPRKTLAELPEHWQPTASHHAAAAKLNLPAGRLESKAEDMRIWARSNAVRKADWDQTFHGFLRRAASEGTGNGQGRPRAFQDDAKSVSRAIDAQIGKLSFPPRPRLVPDTGQDDLRLLPPGRSTGP